MVKTIKIKGEKPYGVLVALDGRKYLPYSLNGAKKVLIVSDEGVFKLHGDMLKRIVKGACDSVYTFIYPSTENGKGKHVLDKLFILMTELNITKDDCIIAFGNQTVASLVGFASAVFKGGVPYIYIPTTFLSMLNCASKKRASIDFIGKNELLSVANSPVAVFVDPYFLATNKEQDLQDGYAEAIRLFMAMDKNALLLLEKGDMPLEDLIYKIIKIKATPNKKQAFAMLFSNAIQSAGAINPTYSKLVASGIMSAIDAGMTLGVCEDVEQRVALLFKKFNVNFDAGISSDKMWEQILSVENKKINLILPSGFGSVRIIQKTKEKIKETF